MFLSEKKVNNIKEEYPKGTRIRLINMEDPQAVPPGTYGTVDHVDDAGQIHMHWDNGRGLALVPEEDQFALVQRPGQRPEEMRVIIVEPNQAPRVEIIKNTLEAQQAIVGGDIEELYLAKDAVAICNEEGKPRNLEANRKNGSDIIAGTFFIAGDDGLEYLVSLTDEQIDTYMEQFQEIEQYTQEEMQNSMYMKIYGGM